MVPVPVCTDTQNVTVESITITVFDDLAAAKPAASPAISPAIAKSAGRMTKNNTRARVQLSVSLHLELSVPSLLQLPSPPPQLLPLNPQVLIC
jgi:hypothetical protein